MRMPRMLFRNLGDGTFEELTRDKPDRVLLARHCSRGCAFGDFDNDGDLDILIMNRNEPPSLLRNDVTGENHWLKVKLIGVKSNRSAVGAPGDSRVRQQTTGSGGVGAIELSLGE